MKRQTQLALLSATGLVAAGSLAYAAEARLEPDAQHIATAKVSLAQAVTTAEQHVQGKATRAEFEDSKLGWTYDVEVVSGRKVFDVEVDAGTGAVLASVEDKSDRDDEHDEKD